MATNDPLEMQATSLGVAPVQEKAKRTLRTTIQPTVVQSTPIQQLNPDYEKPKLQEDDASFSELAGAAINRQWVGSALVDMAQDLEASQETYDPTYTPTVDSLTNLQNLGWSQRELERVSASTSSENFSYNVNRVNEQRDAAKTLQSAGLTGTAFEIGAAILDPTMIPLLFVGSPIAGTSKLGSVGMAMARGVTEATLSEVILHANDTQRTDDDILFSALGGAAFGALPEMASALKGVYSRKLLDSVDNVNSLKISAIKETMDEADNISVLTATRSTHPSADEVAVSRMNGEDGTFNKFVETKKTKLMDSDPTFKSMVEKGSNLSKRAVDLEERIANYELLETIGGTKFDAEIAALKQDLYKVESRIASSAADTENYARTTSLSSYMDGKVDDKDMVDYMSSYKNEDPLDFIVNASSSKFNPDDNFDYGGAFSGEIGSVAPEASLLMKESASRLLSDTFKGADAGEITTSVANTLASAIRMQVPRSTKSYTGKLVSLYAGIAKSHSGAIRGFNAMVFKDALRVDGSVGQSASELAEVLFSRKKIEFNNEQLAFTQWMNQRKGNSKLLHIPVIKHGELERLHNEFDNLVAAKQVSGTLTTDIADTADDAITAAAKVRSRINRESLGDNKQYGVYGFGDIEHKIDYVTVRYDADKILNGADINAARSVISEAYQTGGRKVRKESADLIADAILSRTLTRTGVTQSGLRSLSSEGFGGVRKSLLDSGVPKEVVQQLEETLTSSDITRSLSPRAMASLEPNMKATKDGLSFLDVIDTSIRSNMDYAAEAAANAGIASRGIRSRSMLEGSIRIAYNDAKLSLSDALSKASTAKEKAAIKKAMSDEDGLLEEFNLGIKALYQEPIEATTTTIQSARTFRKAVSVFGLKNSGLASVPEYAAAVVYNGAKAMMGQLSNSRLFDLRTKSIAQDAFMNDMSRSMFTTGHQDYIFGRDFYQGGSYDDVSTSKWLGRVNKVLGSAMDVTMTANLFRTVQSGGEEMVVRSTLANLQRSAKSGSLSKAAQRSLVKHGGMTEKAASEVLNVLAKHEDILKGVNSLPRHLRDSLSVAVRQNVNTSFLKDTLGEAPTYTQKEFGKWLTSMKRFVLLSYEKQLVRGVRSDRAALAAIISMQGVIGLGLQQADTYIKAQGMEESQREAFIKKNSDVGSFGFAFGTVSRIGFIAAPMELINMGAYAAGEMSGSPVEGLRAPSIYPLSAAGSVGSSVLAAGEVGVNLVSNHLSDKEVDIKERRAAKLLPWYNTTVYNALVQQTMNTM